MAETLGKKLKHAWNAFTDQDSSHRTRPYDMGSVYGGRPDRVKLNFSNERSIISSIYTRLSIDIAAVDIRHVRLDEEDRYVEDMKSPLNECLKIQANLDQAARHFRQDVAMSLFNDGVVAIVAVETSVNPMESGSYDILKLRAGPIVQWLPKQVRVNLYNEDTGRREEVLLDKKVVAIIENPLFSVMNEPNSTLQRLIRKLNLLDSVDEQSSSGKLDMIIQLPYVIKTEDKRKQAEQRKKDIEFQLRGSQYGIAYTDGTEKVIQLNRPAENNLMGQVEYLLKTLYSQLGLTEEVMNGTADEATMLNYMNRTVEPVIGAVVEAMIRAFLSKTARTQHQSIMYFRDPFKLIPMKDLAEIADKFNRNEIVTGNEFRGFIGMKPSKDPKADELRNSNMPPPAEVVAPPVDAAPASTDPAAVDDSTAIFNDAFDEVDSKLNDVFNNLGVPVDG